VWVHRVLLFPRVLFFLKLGSHHEKYHSELTAPSPARRVCGCVDVVTLVMYSTNSSAFYGRFLDVVAAVEEVYFVALGSA
jgi:hypothetical protein